MEDQSEQNRRKPYGLWIRYWMKKRGFTREEFGKRTGYSQENLLRILYDQVPPTRADLVKFAIVLDLRSDSKQDLGKRYPTNRFINLSDEELASLYSIPKDGPELPHLYKF